ncbi:MAG TPA: SufE family protein [Flavobacteriales bacterium]|nr:SufE family protein [Flavobacteriales bacterium]
MLSIDKIQDEIIADFGIFDDWMGKYEHLIDFGSSLPLIDDKYKLDENLIKGCQSKVWLNTEMKDDKVIFSADSDAVITKGLVGLMVHVLSNQTPEAIVNADLYFIDKIGLKDHLSPNRSNGLLSMIKQMKLFALGYTLKK